MIPTQSRRMLPRASSNGIGVRRAGRVLCRGTWNYFAGHPVVVSFEVTHSCNAACRHCDKGGLKPEERHISPREFGRLSRELKPAVIQISGGEPLLREDLDEIIREVGNPRGSPFTILVTNGRLLTEDKYSAFRRSGVDQFSVSLDFPDERHDTFRCQPGLFAHLSRLLPRLAGRGGGDLVLNTAITRGNVPELTNLARLAKEWGVRISFSAYSKLRTGSFEHLPAGEEELGLLRSQIRELATQAAGGGVVVTSPRILWRTLEFFQRGELSGCPAGRLFLVVEPDGKMVPCSMIPEPQSSVRSLRENFVRSNTCGACFVSVRSFIDGGYWRVLGESLRTYWRLAARSA